MANMVVLDVDNTGIIMSDAVYADDTLTAAGAVTYLAGTVLARNSSTNKLVVYTAGGATGTNIPKAVLTYDVTFTGAGDKPIRPLIKGEVRREKLIAHGVGAVTQAEVDALRDYSITAIASTAQLKYDNQ